MDFEDFLLARKGWNDGRINDIMLARKQTFIMAITLGQKPAALEKAWPDPTKPSTAPKMVNYGGTMMTAKQAQILAKNKKNAELKREAKKQNG